MCNNMKNILLFLTIHLVIGFTVQTYPNPLTSPKTCNTFKGEPSYICDPDSIVNQTTISSLHHYVKDVHLHRNITCEDGTVVPIQFVIAIMNNIQEHSAFSFAKKLYDSYGIGRKGCGNGVLFVLSVNDRKMSFATGFMTKRILQNKLHQGIYDVMKPYLKDHNVDIALIRGMNMTKNIILKNKELKIGKTGIWKQIVAAICCILATYYCCFTRPSKRDTILKELNKGGKVYIENHCPICFDSYNNRKSLCCGHTFCKSCILEWLKSSNTNQCPICKTSVVKDVPVTKTPQRGNANSSETIDWFSIGDDFLDNYIFYRHFNHTQSDYYDTQQYMTSRIDYLYPVTNNIQNTDPSSDYGSSSLDSSTISSLAEGVGELLSSFSGGSWNDGDGGGGTEDNW